MMTFEELMALPDEAWDKVGDAIKEAITEETDDAMNDKVREQIAELHDCKRGLSVGTPEKYNNWWRTMQAQADDNERLEGDLQIMRLQRDAKLVSETPTSNALKQEIERLGEVVEAARHWQRDGRSNSAGDLLCDLLAKLDRGDK